MYNSLKRLLSWAGITVLSVVLFSCQQDDETIEPSPLEIEVNSASLVDPTTPSDAQPLILEGEGSSSRVAAPPGSASNWTMTFSDEFNGSSIDGNKWRITNSTKSRNPRPSKGIQKWYWRTDHVSVSNGKARLQVSKHNHNTMYCGSIDTKGKFEPTYGFYEARIQVADINKATHTAFWTQGSNMGNVDGTGHDGAELDVFESAWTGNYTKAVIHIDGYGSAHMANTKQYNTPNLHSGYHVFGFEWTESNIKIYYDGTFKVQYGGKWIPRVPEWLWVSDGASFGDGDFTGQPVGVLTAAYVDYVRGYDRVASSGLSGRYIIQNVYTNKVLRPLNGGTGNNVNIIQYGNMNWGTQKWDFIDAGGGYYKIKNVHTGKMLRVKDGSTADNAQIVQYSDQNWQSMQWKLEDAGSGYYWIKNRYSSKYLRPLNAGTGDNVNIVQYPLNTGWSSMKWKLNSAN